MEPKVYLLDEQTLTHQHIDPDALFIINKLRDEGHAAYIVGGCIRDLLTHRKPKDFDISTSAKPEEIKAIFRRSCILIGRRFRLAHIRCGKKVFEVSTFRAGNPEEEELVVRDNVWGSPEEDALRRDFTINGLFYDPIHRTIIDYVGGWEDIQARVLRSIGNATRRFKQDPVRMIRLLKFMARFDFTVDTDCMEALRECREEILKSAPARILEEVFKMLESGSAKNFFQHMTEEGFFSLIFPRLDQYLQGEKGEEMFKYLEIIDRIHERNQNITLERPLFIASLLFPILKEQVESEFLQQEKIPNMGDIILLCQSIIKEVLISSFSHFPKRLSGEVAAILSFQYKLTPLSKKRYHKNRMMNDRAFYPSLRFLKIRAIYDENNLEDYYAWEKAYRQHKHHGERTPREPKVRPKRKRTYKRYARRDR